MSARGPAGAAGCPDGSVAPATAGKRPRRPASARRGASGAALVLVLMATLLLGLMALSLSFTVTLDSLAARHVQEAALAEGQAEAALALAAAEAATDVLAAAGALDGVQRLGPWPDAGVEGSADVTLEAERIIRVSAHASVGRSSVRRSVAFELIHDGSVRLLARP